MYRKEIDLYDSRSQMLRPECRQLNFGIDDLEFVPAESLKSSTVVKGIRRECDVQQQHCKKNCYQHGSKPVLTGSTSLVKES